MSSKRFPKVSVEKNGAAGLLIEVDLAMHPDVDISLILALKGVGISYRSILRGRTLKTNCFTKHVSLSRFLVAFNCLRLALQAVLFVVLLFPWTGLPKCVDFERASHSGTRLCRQRTTMSQERRLGLNSLNYANSHVSNCQQRSWVRNAQRGSSLPRKKEIRVPSSHFIASWLWRYRIWVNEGLAI